MTTSLQTEARISRAFLEFTKICLVLMFVTILSDNLFGQCTNLGTPGETLDPLNVPKFENDLPVIRDLGLRIDLSKGKVEELTVRMKETEQDLGLGLIDDEGNPVKTKVWGYQFPGKPTTYPGATIIAMEDKPINIKWVNELPGHFLPVDASLHMAHPNNIHGAAAVREWYAEGNVPTVAHLHGGHTESASDGLPEAWFTQDFAEKGNFFVKESYWYDNDQEAGTLWYHDHALGITRLNVYAGLAGFYLLRDKNEERLIEKEILPKGEYEIEIVIQDRLFDNKGQLFWPAYEGQTPYEDFIIDEGAVLPNDIFPVDGGPTALAEMFGNIILVNGKAWPKLEVEPRKYRFRLLNGSDSRFYILRLDNGSGPGSDNIMVIGTDDALLPEPVVVNQLAIAPGERYDLIVDFSGYTNPDGMPNGAALTLKNFGPDAPAGGAGIDPSDVACPETTGKIMQFQVTKPFSNRSDATVSLGTKLRNPINDLKPDAPSRQLVLFEGMDEFGRLQPMLGTLTQGSQTWFEPITENPMLDDTEIWEVYNATGDAHPIHLHLVAFQILNRQNFTGSVASRPQIQHNSLPGDPLTDPEVAATYGTGGVLSVTSLDGPIIPPEPHEMGWKDTFIVPPGQVGRVIAHFDRPGRYVWHCHILSHEDHEMMRPFHVGPMPAAARMASNIERNIENVPNPFQDKTQILFDLKKSQDVDFTVYDTQGKLLYHNLNFYREGKNAIFWDGFDKEGKLLPTGVYIYRLQGENFKEAKKLVIER